MYLLHTGKEVLKPSVSNGSFAHFSSCWEKWAVGDTFLMQSAAVDKKYASGGKQKLPLKERTLPVVKIHRHVRKIDQGAASAAPKVRDG